MEVFESIKILKCTNLINCRPYIFDQLQMIIFDQLLNHQSYIGQGETIQTVLTITKLVRLYHTYSATHTKVGRVET